MKKFFCIAAIFASTGCVRSPIAPRATAAEQGSTARSATVCTTDADCAAWEERNHVPAADRCYGAPCQATPQHNNIVATFAGDPQGPLVYLCATKLRTYTDYAGHVQHVEDHYLQYAECPAVLID